MKDNNRENSAYDIIGDIHGHAAELEALLHELGYRELRTHFKHPEGRKVIFLGDYIDRGPEIRRSLSIVRGMIDAGEALGILGNHEINALRYHHKGPDGEWLRPHWGNQKVQHQATLDQLANKLPAEWEGWLHWLAQLPLYLDLPGLRAVHASWFDSDISRIKDHEPLIDDELIRLSSKGNPDADAIGQILNGLELALPEGEAFETPDGRRRTEIRSRWWDDLREKNCREAVFPDDPRINEGSFILPDWHRPYPAAAKPVFFGHYAVRDVMPAPLADNVACLDYGLGKGGQLVAYRWDGEAKIDDSRFVSIPQI
ncbi:MAG: metallophosphoesterase, partial [Opitutales bacterium]